MKLPDKQDDEKHEPISLYGMSLEDALKRALQAKVDPNEQRKPGAGRKKKPALDQGSTSA